MKKIVDEEFDEFSSLKEGEYLVVKEYGFESVKDFEEKTGTKLKDLLNKKWALNFNRVFIKD